VTARTAPGERPGSGVEPQALFQRFSPRVESALERCLPSSDAVAKRLHEAMRYAVLAGGKRLRAVLVYCAGGLVGAPLERLDAPACAVELLHAYSLIHDDLPAMDDDDLRRGKPSCHKAFDEATAILAGDALQSLAFEVLASLEIPFDLVACQLEMLRRFARASGSGGMAGGQALDLAYEGQLVSLADLESMHSLKTGALIRASVLMGALCGGPLAPRIVDALDEYARCLGLAFQIRDDVLDIEADTQTLGKPQGSDEASGKSTYPALLGLEGAKRAAQAMHERASSAIEGLGPAADSLRALSEFAITRGY